MFGALQLNSEEHRTNNHRKDDWQRAEGVPIEVPPIIVATRPCWRPKTHPTWERRRYSFGTQSLEFSCPLARNSSSSWAPRCLPPMCCFQRGAKWHSGCPDGRRWRCDHPTGRGNGAATSRVVYRRQVCTRCLRIRRSGWLTLEDEVCEYAAQRWEIGLRRLLCIPVTNICTMTWLIFH